MLTIDRRRLVVDFFGILSKEGLSASDAAQVIEVHPGTLRAWRTGKRDLPSLKACCLIAGNFGLDLLSYVKVAEDIVAERDRLAIQVEDLKKVNETLEAADAKWWETSSELQRKIDTLVVVRDEVAKERDKFREQELARYSQFLALEQNYYELDVKHDKLLDENEQLRKSIETMESTIRHLSRPWWRKVLDFRLGLL